MDNFHIDVTSEGVSRLQDAMRLAFSGHGRNTVATHYAVREAREGKRWEAPDGYRHPHLMDWQDRPKPHRLVFFWSGTSSPSDAVALPFKLDADGAADFAQRWLAEQDYGRQPDHDGDNGKGWRLYCEGWGHVDGQWQAFVAVAPSWTMYGK